MKVALLSDCYLPRLGGIEVQVAGLAEQLRRRGHEVEVLTATPGRAGERHGAVELVDGVPVHHLALRLPGDLPVNPFAGAQVRALLREGGFDLAHGHMGVVSPFARLAVDAALDAGLPTAVTWHCVIGGMEPVLRVSGLVRRWSDRGAALSAVSRMASRPLERLAPGASVAVLHNGIDLDRWRPERATTCGALPGPGVGDAPLDRPVTLVTAMRLAARKRPVPLVRVLRRVDALVGDRVDWCCDVYGEGPQERLVRTAVHEAGLDARVTLRGRVSRDALREAYARADVYVSPVRLEAFGIAALEARTVGLPVVGLRASGVAEVVEDGVSGLMAGGDLELAGAVATLVADPFVRQSIRRHNETCAPDQGWDRVAGQVEQEYARAVACSARRRGDR